MTIDFTQSPNYDAILEALLEKTKAGKINWSATSEPSTFVAAVKGTQTNGTVVCLTAVTPWRCRIRVVSSGRGGRLA